jgi:hypothetical protein
VLINDLQPEEVGVEHQAPIRLVDDETSEDAQVPVEEGNSQRLRIAGTLSAGRAEGAPEDLPVAARWARVSALDSRWRPIPAGK